MADRAEHFSLDQIKSRAQDSRIGTLIGQLDAALKEAGIEKNSFGEKYFPVFATSVQSTHYAMGLACSRWPAAWGPQFKLFRNIPGSRPRRPCLRPGSGIDEYSA